MLVAENDSVKLGFNREGVGHHKGKISYQIFAGSIKVIFPSNRLMSRLARQYLHKEKITITTGEFGPKECARIPSTRIWVSFQGGISREAGAAFLGAVCTHTRTP